MGHRPTSAPVTPPTLALKPGTAWSDVWRRCRELAPEAFADDGRVFALWRGGWQAGGASRQATSPVDGTRVCAPPSLDAGTARQAVSAALDQHRAWRHVALSERRARVAATLDALAEHRELLALLLVWDIGKPWRLARADVDRAVDGVRWYVDRIDTMLDGRTPLPGPVSNLPGWNNPMSVLVRAMLVQALAGNAVIARAPAEGGAAGLTLACALAAREGLPLTLVGGDDPEVTGHLVRAPEIGCFSFAGGGDTAPAADAGKRHIAETEGLNSWGVWDYSDWEALTPLIRGTFEHAKQRGGSCPRFVVQRRLFAGFLDAYLAAVRSVRFGHPLAVAHPEDYLPELDFGPLIDAATAAELAARTQEAVEHGAVPLYQGTLADGRFLPGQDTSAYLPPTALLSPPPSSPLRRGESAGPVGTVVLADSEAELVAGMNAGDDALTATLSTDDGALYDRLAPRIRAARTDRNRPRSRPGAFAGGELLVHAVTDGRPGGRPPGGLPGGGTRPKAGSPQAAA
ncbi:aldehyde dehydrogenase [Streptomyces daqingensis]|uniref:Aldehyde dehydrogenase n=1 Tax=Streptomyces daqingensis TaxID=1472640 RepID=A0ABQ2LVF4_9ACTN|nr:aldehyde dehydrogenase family protein [Streptomyces daqingensis]GGO43829.1 aldehyde dehydrogenase [Streptomyces daqingensis]